MTRLVYHPFFQDRFEYHGNTGVEWVRKQGAKTIKRRWIMFDSVEEAQAFFNSECGCERRCHVQ